MKSLKNSIIEKNTSLTEIERLVYIEPTITPVINQFLKNKGALINCMLSGTFILTLPNLASGNEKKIAFTETIENFDTHLEKYSKNINNSISSYLQEIKTVSTNRNYSKKDLILEILSFKSLKDNWDGRGGYPLEVESASNVINLIDLVGENTFCSVDELATNPNGTISLIWNNKSGETISLEVGNKTMSYYVDLASKETLFFDNIEINRVEAKKISDYIQIL